MKKNMNWSYLGKPGDLSQNMNERSLGEILKGQSQVLCNEDMEQEAHFFLFKHYPMF